MKTISEYCNVQYLVVLFPLKDKLPLRPTFIPSIAPSAGPSQFPTYDCPNLLDEQCKEAENCNDANGTRKENFVLKIMAPLVMNTLWRPCKIYRKSRLLIFSFWIFPRLLSWVNSCYRSTLIKFSSLQTHDHMDGQTWRLK